MPWWGPDRDFGPADGVSMDVVPAGSHTGRIFVARMRRFESGGDSIRTYYSTDGGYSWYNWYTIYTTSGYEFNDFCIACSRESLAVFFQYYSSSWEYLAGYIFDFSSGYTYLRIDSTSSPVTEMHPDFCSDSEDFSSYIWFYLVYTKGSALRYIIFDESGDVHGSGTLADPGYDGDIDWDSGNLFVCYSDKAGTPGTISARFSSDLGGSWLGPWQVGASNDDSKPRIAGHNDHAVVVMEDFNDGVAYNYTTDFGTSWAGSWLPCDPGDGCPAITEADYDNVYGIYFSNEKKEARACYMDCTVRPWKGYWKIGDAWATVRPYAHCYETRYLWNSGYSKGGTVWIDNRSGSWHAWFDGPYIIGIEEEASLEPSFVRLQTKPNPATRMIEIRYALPQQRDVTLEVLDISGRKIKTLVRGIEPAGSHVVRWKLIDEKGKAVPSGVYFCRLKAGEFTTTHKILVAK